MKSNCSKNAQYVPSTARSNYIRITTTFKMEVAQLFVYLRNLNKIQCKKIKSQIKIDLFVKIITSLSTNAGKPVPTRASWPQGCGFIPSFFSLENPCYKIAKQLELEYNYAAWSKNSGTVLNYVLKRFLYRTYCILYSTEIFQMEFLFKVELPLKLSSMKVSLVIIS